MELKRTFSEADWLATPQPVRDCFEQLEQTVIHLSEHIVRLENRIDELEARLGMNSQNSNKPPSSDPPFSKPEKKSKPTPKKAKRKKGGQKGHKGNRRELLEPRWVENLMPPACPCGSPRLADQQAKPFYIHQVIEFPKVEMDITHLVLHRATCPDCGRTVKASLAKPSRSGYGPRLSALIAELSGMQGASRESVQGFCRSVLGFPISIGAIQNVIDRASEAIGPIHDEIGRLTRKAEINHIDETSFFKEGRLQWLWAMVNDATAYFRIHPHRSKAAFLDLIQDWNGTLVSDDYGVYLKWFKKRQTCLAHLIRAAVGLSEKKDKSLKAIGIWLADELRRLCRWAKEPPDLDEELAFYGRLVQFLTEHRDRKDDAGKLTRRMLSELDSLWLCLNEPGVEPTNNRAERALRFAVLWRKRSKGTQSTKGDRWVERILTLKETARLRSVSTYELLTQAIDSFFKDRKPDFAWISTE